MTLAVTRGRWSGSAGAQRTGAQAAVLGHAGGDRDELDVGFGALIGGRLFHSFLLVVTIVMVRVEGTTSVRKKIRRSRGFYNIAYIKIKSTPGKLCLSGGISHGVEGQSDWPGLLQVAEGVDDLQRHMASGVGAELIAAGMPGHLPVVARHLHFPGRVMVGRGGAEAQVCEVVGDSEGFLVLSRHRDVGVIGCRALQHLRDDDPEVDGCTLGLALRLAQARE